MKKNLFSLLIALFLGVLAVGSAGDPENINVDLDVPITVVEGEEFMATVVIQNTDSKAQDLVSIDIMDSYLDGIIFVKSEPEYNSVSHIDLSETNSYVFDRTIPGNGEIEVKLYFQALREGDYSGDFDFCINSDFSFLTHTTRTVVVDD